MTKKEQTMIYNFRQYEKSTMESIYKAYKTPSVRKQRFWEHLKEMCFMLGGHDLKVVSKNSQIFTAGFVFPDKETGVLKYMHITPTTQTVIDMP